MESELFGHEKGAFTGADRQRIGKFEQCDQGTLFLDEVGDMSPLTQGKVLRVLQEQQFERLGGVETIHVDVRIISATNRDLEQMIEDGEFRLDLFHRLNSFEILLPPLRERGDDIQVLLAHFLSAVGKGAGKDLAGVSDAATEMLKRYPWPGNVRELQAALRQAVLMATGPVLIPENLPQAVQGDLKATKEDAREPLDLASFIDGRQAVGSSNLYAEALEWMERYLITRVLREQGGNQSRAAELLGITRGSLRNKIKTLGVSITSVVEKNG